LTTRGGPFPRDRIRRPDHIGTGLAEEKGAIREGQGGKKAKIICSLCFKGRHDNEEDNSGYAGEGDYIEEEYTTNRLKIGGSSLSSYRLDA
jgi:hypothetical protein